MEKLHIDVKSRGEKEHLGGTLVSALIPDNRRYKVVALNVTYKDKTESRGTCVCFMTLRLKSI